MNRQAYIAELSHLLYYMAPWDRDAVIEKYDRILSESNDLDALIQEIGTPMKLAVTLSRNYEPSPEPKPGEPKPTPISEKEAPPHDEPTAGDLPEDENSSPSEDEPSLEEEPSSDEEPNSGEEPATEEVASGEELHSDEPSSEEAAIDDEASNEDESVTGADPSTETDPPAREEPAAEAEPHNEDIEIQVVEISSEEESLHSGPQPQETDAIFSEILNAATQAQSPISLKGTQSTRRPRPGILIPYIIACILIGIPVMVILFIVNLLIFGSAVMILAFDVYLLSFWGTPEFAGAGNRLLILGMAVLCATAAAAMVALGIWFLQNAMIELPRFLIRFGQEHGYTKEGTI